MKKNILLLSFLAYIAFFQNADSGEFTGAGIKLRQILESSSLHYDDLVEQGYDFLIKKEYENNDSLDLSKIRWFVLNNNLISINDVLSFKFSNGSILNMRHEGHELSTAYFSELSSLILQNKKIPYNQIKVLVVK
jgi:hypothetical protein